MTEQKAYLAPRIFDGEGWQENAGLIVENGVVAGVVRASDIPVGAQTITLADGFIAPGFVDLQVNGGGGVMLNDHRSVEGIRTICAAHQRFGTTALLPTLITDTPEITAEAVAAGIEAARLDVPGFLGLHLEGPHLSIARKGAHDPELIREMEDVDLANLIAARVELPVLLTTVAVESVTPQQIAALAGADVKVSIGHTEATLEAAQAAFDAGATTATHLFNAMSPIGNREPGLVGAVLSIGGLSAGLIADGYHVHPESIGIAMRSKRGPGHIFLVTDAMATIGTDMTEFTLNGRTIKRADGRLTLLDGTLAGADLDMISAVRFMHQTIGIELDEAMRMASLYPARVAGVAETHGHLGNGARADFVHISDDLAIRGVWIGGEAVHLA
ncbi:N-acetylglucosamine-6-phosphate deacetylase [Mesorhizobium sp. GR13]|uniref:N-acetylglucosamine-6-phosphate deacetylase n=1 Tax=Mesorhizobium sp. GR13 TaxID=2562308 RepID=UPI0010BFEC17|nr:N-acetylglucosamine-6-phosphate deacetylase [Mesorhizobium sp. GR13]